MTLREGIEVDRIMIERGKMAGVGAAEQRWQAPKVVIAGGAWSSKILAQVANLNFPVEPVRGQMMIFKSNPQFLKRIVLGESHYLIPRRDGRVLVGSTLEYVGFKKAATRQAYNRLYQAALELVPALEEYPVEFHWSGLRPGTKNQGIPYIGEVEGVQGLYVNAGHFRNGVVLAPASARLLVDVMLHREPIVDPTSYQFIPQTTEKIV